MRWTTKSTAKLAEELTATGHRVSPSTVGKLLKARRVQPAGERQDHRRRPAPDRDAQFGYLNDQVDRVPVSTGDPVISVDTKKKELVGNFKLDGREWEPAGCTRPIKVHDFVDKQLGQGRPVRGVRHRRQHRLGQRRHRRRHRPVRGGVDPPLVEHHGRRHLPATDRLLITADSGGSNGSRLRLWKTELAALATETGLDDHRLPPAAGHHQVEQDRAPAVLRDQPQLARPDPWNPTRSSSKPSGPQPQRPD